MSRSLLQMVKALEVRVSALEERSREDQQAKSDVAEIMRQVRDNAVLSEKPSRKMCPKCGEQPDYFFHVKNCTGPKNKNKNADDRNGSSGTPK